MLQIAIGDKNLSSWSMRPWLVLKASGLRFKELKILLDRPGTKKLLARHSPTGRVPALKVNGATIWDSLAICELIHELAPDKDLWPSDPKWRALARAYCAEMHSGFVSLRTQLPMNIQLRSAITHLLPSTQQDIERILQLWDEALRTTGGPFLFKKFSIADAFFAPVVLRFQSYGIKTKNRRIQKYRNRILQHPAVRAWVRDAEKEQPYYLKF